MPWMKVDDQLWSHPKFAGLSDAAQALWLRAGTWSAAHLTGGFVSDTVVRSLLRGRPAVVRELVNVPAGHEHGMWESVDGGFQFHDWDVYQPDAEVEKDRRAEVSRVRSEAGRKGARARWGDGKRDGKPVANAWQADGNAMAPSPNPSPNPVSADAETHSRPSGPSTAELEKRFDEAWQHWPKKQKRKPALAKFLAAVKRKPVDELVAAIIRFGDAYTAAGTPTNFVPGLEVWLNQERWDDALPEPDVQETAAQRNLSVVERFAAREGRSITLDEMRANRSRAATRPLGETPGQRRDRELREFATAADPKPDEVPEEPAADFVLGADGVWGERRP